MTILTFEELEELRQQFALSDSASYGGVTYSAIPEKAIMGLNEWGCYGRTMSPHATYDSGIRVVRVHAISQCDSRVNTLYVSTQLYREYNCYLGYCLSRQTWGPPDSHGQANAWRVVATSTGPCWNNEYYAATSIHSMIGPNGRQYIAVTEKRAQVTDC